MVREDHRLELAQRLDGRPPVASNGNGILLFHLVLHFYFVLNNFGWVRVGVRVGSGLIVSVAWPGASQGTLTPHPNAAL